MRGNAFSRDFNAFSAILKNLGPVVSPNYVLTLPRPTADFGVPICGEPHPPIGAGDPKSVKKCLKRLFLGFLAPHMAQGVGAESAQTPTIFTQPA